MKKTTQVIAIVLVLMFVAPLVLAALGQNCHVDWIPIMVPVWNVWEGIVWVTVGYYPVQICSGGGGGTE